MVHTNVIAYGFLANAFLGSLHWAVPRLMLKPVLDRRLSWFILVAWQIVVLATGVGIVLGPTLQANVPALESLPFALGAQGLEWGETPVWIDPLALAGLLLVAINFMASDRAIARADVCHVVVLHGGVRVDVPDLCDGKLSAAVLVDRH